MNYTLTAKENSLLKDLKSHEELCIQKYSDYANQASDPQLKQLFSDLGQKEQQHLNTINQLANGQIPAMNQQGQQQQQQQQRTYNFQPYQPAGANANQSQNKDKYLCSDLLSTEKHVSATYGTAIFEFREPQARDTLNHIQKEEQQHGEAIYKYMESQGMYNAQ